MRVLLLVATILSAGPALAEESGRPGTTPGWEYRVAVSADGGRLDVRICFHGFLPRRLVLDDEALLGFVTPGDGMRTAPSGGGLVADGLVDGGCVEYAFDVATLVAKASRAWNAQRVGGALVSQPGLWLLRPALWPPGAAVGLEFVLPEGFEVSVPWTPVGPHRYRLPCSTCSLESRVAIGRFAVMRVEAPGAVLDVAVLEGARRATDDGIRRWISEAANAVADLFGRFPVERAQILVRPVASGGEPVLFGQAMPGGGDGVMLILSSEARDEDLPGEWVAVHEMTHLGMPPLGEEGAWLNEGFVTYYQEVLRARAGLLTERGGWEGLESGFGRGRRDGSGRPLLEESREMGRHHAYRRVYWAGAALALMIDLEIRHVTSGRFTLDDALRRFSRKGNPDGGAWRGLDLLEAVDRWLGRPLAAPIAKEWLARSEFPDLAATYEALGLRAEGGRISFVDGAPQAAARSAIMRRGGR